MIKEHDIRQLADSLSYKRGCVYFQQKKVKKLIEHTPNLFMAKVAGSEIYSVSISLNDNGAIKRCSCDCPAYYQYDGACKHIVATLKEIQVQQEKSQKANAQFLPQSRLMSMFKSVLTPKKKSKELSVQLIPTCHLHVNYMNVFAYLEFTIGATRQYVLKNTLEFLRAITNGESIVYGKEFTLDANYVIFDHVSQKLVDMMVGAFEDGQSLHGSLTSDIFQQKKFVLTPSKLEEFFSIMEDMPFKLEINDRRSWNNYQLMIPTDGRKLTVNIIEGRPPIKILVKDHFGKGQLSISGGEIVNLDNKYRYLLYNNELIYKVDEEFSAVIKPLMKCFIAENAKEIVIGDNEMTGFFSLVMPELERIAPIKVDNNFWRKFEVLPLTAVIYFDYYQKGIRAKLTFTYGDKTINPLITEATNVKNEGKSLIRDMACEKEILAVFSKYDFVVVDGFYLQENEEKNYDFLVKGVPLLTDLAEVYYADEFKNKEIKSIGNIKAGIKVNENSILELSLNHTNFNFNELLEILSAYRLKKRYHRLNDGTFISLESEELNTIADFVEQVDWKKGKEKDLIQIPLAKAVYLDSLARETKGLKLERSADFKKMVQEIREPVDVEIEIPKSLDNILRDYQKVGFKWLATLAQYHLGGILADDMGLGKTLQVLAFLLREKQCANISVLIVTPTSLMYNWADEIERFAPELSVIAVSGTQVERMEKLETANEFDIVLTTYNLLKRDIEIYKKINFTYCFLDEAQHIKNPNTLNAKTVKQIHTKGYFALTGTPIENTLTELWSIFDFLMPGYLLSHQAFKKKFEQPIVKNNDELAAKELKRYIAPFVLRRLKRDVLKELPDKTESKLLNEMTDEQAKIYAGFFAQAQKEFAEELAKNGFEKSHFKILAILTRLRQICCHPSLFLEDYEGGSGKLEVLREVIGDAIESGHRILLFSQFTSMLSLIRTELEDMGITFYYLDGSTPALERIRMVKEFNQGEVPVFLISLKAGGTGLNLTGADMVIHYDPWWNPAVEDQASDRAYRLGQKKNVQVLKFITKDTVEEKIFALQQKKKGLIDQMIQPGETFVSKLTETEIKELFIR